MSCSDRERAEGFQCSPSSTVTTTGSERAEGFQCSPSSTVTTTGSERAEGLHQLLRVAVLSSQSERAGVVRHTRGEAVDQTVQVPGDLNRLVSRQFIHEVLARRDVRGTGEARTDDPVFTRERFRKLGLGAGVVTFVGHVVLFPPGSPWVDVAWPVVWASAAIGTLPGYLGLDARAGLAGASPPGLALALRGEIIPFYYGCFSRLSEAGVCVDPPSGTFRRRLLPLGVSVGFVLAAAAVGYAIGACVRRTLDRVRER